MVEKVVVVLLTILMSGGWFHDVIPTIPRTLHMLVGVALAFGVLWRYLPQMIETILRAPFLSLLILLIGASVFWSFALEFSLDAIVWALLTSVWGLYIGMRFSLEEQQSVFLWTVIVALLLTLLALPIVPEAMIHGADSPHTGNWHGIFAHKNQFGVFMALGFGQLLILGRRWGVWRIPLLALLLLAVVQAGSATAILLSIMPLALAPVLRLLQLRHQVLAGLLLIAIPLAVTVGVLLLLNAEAILVALGRSPTLTGRTLLWEASFDLIGQRPVLGWGMFGAFAPESPIMDAIVWESPFAHNHWVDLLLNLGLVGALLYTLALVNGLVRAVRYINVRKTLESRYALLLLLQLNFAVLAMQDLTTMANLMWISFVAVLYGLALAQQPAEQMRFRRPAPRSKFAPAG